MAQKKNGKQKEKSKKGILSAILVVFIIIPLLFIGIVDGLTSIITGIATTVAEIVFETFNPLRQIQLTWQATQWTGAQIENFCSRLFGSSNFNPSAYLFQMQSPEIEITEEQFNQEMEKLESVIDLEDAGLTRKNVADMLLAYLTNTYPENYTIKINMGGLSIPKKDNGKISLLKVIENEDGTQEFVNMACYSEEGLAEIYQNEYIANLNADGTESEYSKAVREFLGRCYTIGDTAGTIKVYNFQTNEVIEKLQYGDQIWDITYIHTVNSNVTLQTLDYGSAINKYATPVELMTSLMMITGSDGFLEAFIDTVNDVNKIKVGIYDISAKSTETVIEEYNQTTVVSGTREVPSGYHVKRVTSEGDVQDDNITCEVVAYGETADGEIPPDGEDAWGLKITNNTNYRVTVNLYLNGSIVYDENGVDPLHYDVGANNFKFIWVTPAAGARGEVSSQETQRVKKTKIINSVEEKFDTAIISVESWHTIIETENIVEKTNTYYSKNEDGELVEMPSESYRINVITPMQNNTYTRTQTPEIFAIAQMFDENAIISRLSTSSNATNALLNCIFNRVIRLSEENYQECDFDQMDVSYGTNNTVTFISNTRATLRTTVKNVIDNTDVFLGLLSNETGIYTLGSQFKAKSAGGKIVKYRDLFEAEAEAGELLENGAELLFELLESYSSTEGITQIMKYIMWRYSGIDYGITTFDFDEFSTLIGNMRYATNGMGFWWPIGSEMAEERNGILFAAGDPVSSRISSAYQPGGRTLNGETRPHYGIDICVDSNPGSYSPGAYVIAVAPGVVTAVRDGLDNNFETRDIPDSISAGNYVKIDHGNGYETRYLHLYKNTITVNVGDVVEYGQVLGNIGSSGRSSGGHLHFGVKLNGAHVDPVESVDISNPRPLSVGVISPQLYNFIKSFEGGWGYYNEADRTYTVFNNGIDSNLELTGGIAIGTLGAGIFNGYRDIFDASTKVGSIITEEQYNEVLTRVLEAKMVTVDNAIVATEAVLTEQQKDALYSFCYNVSNSYTRTKTALEQFNSSGNKGYWQYTSQFVRSDGAVREGLVRRRAEEFEMFLEGDYIRGGDSEASAKYDAYNAEYGQ